MKVEKLKGKTLGIDAKAWLYSAYFGQDSLGDEIYLGIIRNISKKVSILEK